MFNGVRKRKVRDIEGDVEAWRLHVEPSYSQRVV